MRAPRRRVGLGLLLALLALGLAVRWWRGEAGAPAGGEGQGPAPAPSRTAASAPGAAAGPAAAPGPAASAPGGPGAPAAPPAGERRYALEPDAGVAPEVARLVPEVLRCAGDQALRAPPRLALEVTPVTRDGGRGGRVVVSSSWQDPYLAACVEDVFEELGVPPGTGPWVLRLSLVR